MTIRDLVDRLEKIEKDAGENTRESISLLIDDIIEFDLRMSKVFKDMRKEIDVDEKRLIALIDSGNISEAFFLSRRLVASGEAWAKTYLEQCRSQM